MPKLKKSYDQWINLTDIELEIRLHSFGNLQQKSFCKIMSPIDLKPEQRIIKIIEIAVLDFFAFKCSLSSVHFEMLLDSVQN